MSETLGKMEKPEAQKFQGKKKICVVPLVFASQEAPEDYQEIIKRYWEQVTAHIAGLEAKTSPVARIYHESVINSGEDGLKTLEQMTIPSCGIAREKCTAGAVLEATEDNELAEETVDWERFIMMGCVSRKAAQVVSDNYLEVSRKRFEHIAARISETLKDDEMGVLFIREGHLIQFPPEIEVFSVSPPALDELHRWQRQQAIRQPEPPKPESADKDEDKKGE